MEPLHRLVLDYPIYALTSVSNDHFAVTGGGGPLKSGIPNSCSLVSFDETTGTLAKKANVNLSDAGIAITSLCNKQKSSIHLVFGQGIKTYSMSTSSTKLLKPVSTFHYDVKISSTIDQSAIRTSGNGKVIVLGDDDGSVCVLSLPRFQLIFRGPMHTQGISNLSLSHDGQLACTTSRDRTAIVWYTQTGKILQSINALSSPSTGTKMKANNVRCLRFATTYIDKHLLLFAGEASRDDGYVSVFRYNQQQQMFKPCVSKKSCRQPLTGLSVHLPTCKNRESEYALIAVSSSEGHISVLRFCIASASLTIICCSQPVLSLRDPPHILPITGMAFTASGRFVIAASADKSITVYDTTRVRGVGTSTGRIVIIIVVTFVVLLVGFGVFGIISLWFRQGSRAVRQQRVEGKGKGDVFQDDQSLDNLGEITIGREREMDRGKRRRGRGKILREHDICAAKKARDFILSRSVHIEGVCEFDASLLPPPVPPSSIHERDGVKPNTNANWNTDNNYKKMVSSETPKIVMSPSSSLSTTQNSRRSEQPSRITSQAVEEGNMDAGRRDREQRARYRRNHTRLLSSSPTVAVKDDEESGAVIGGSKTETIIDNDGNRENSETIASITEEIASVASDSSELVNERNVKKVMSKSDIVSYDEMCKRRVRNFFTSEIRNREGVVIDIGEVGGNNDDDDDDDDDYGYVDDGDGYDDEAEEEEEEKQEENVDIMTDEVRDMEEAFGKTGLDPEFEAMYNELKQIRSVNVTPSPTPKLEPITTPQPILSSKTTRVVGPFCVRKQVVWKPPVCIGNPSIQDDSGEPIYILQNSNKFDTEPKTEFNSNGISHTEELSEEQVIVAMRDKCHRREWILWERQDILDSVTIVDNQYKPKGLRKRRPRRRRRNNRTQQ